MVIPDVGLNRTRDLLINDVTNGQAGTDNTTPSSTDVALLAPVTATLSAVTTISSDKSFQTSHVINSVTATGSTFNEWAVFVNSASTALFSRAVTADVSHGANDEITKTTTFFITEN